MQRRSLLTVGCGAAATVPGMTLASRDGVALVTPLQHAGPTVFDFGVVGDGATDDSAAINAALAWAEAEGAVVKMPAARYRVAAPLVLRTTRAHSEGWWGLHGEGATIISKVTGADVFTVDGLHVARYLWLGGFSIEGNDKLDGNGLVLKSLDNAPDSRGHFLYRCSVERVLIEGVGGHGMLIAGGVFESSVQASWFHANGGHGVYLTNDLGGGHVSDIDFVSCRFGNNDQAGLRSDVGGVKITGGYSLANKGPGLDFGNFNPSSFVNGLHLENNWFGTGFSADKAHIHSTPRIHLQNVRGITLPVDRRGRQRGGTQYLVKGHLVDIASMINCGHLRSALPPTEDLRLASFTGSGEITAIACIGTDKIDGGVTVSPLGGRM